MLLTRCRGSVRRAQCRVERYCQRWQLRERKASLEAAERLELLSEGHTRSRWGLLRVLETVLRAKYHLSPTPVAVADSYACSFLEYFDQELRDRTTLFNLFWTHPIYALNSQQPPNPCFKDLHYKSILKVQFYSVIWLRLCYTFASYVHKYRSRCDLHYAFFKRTLWCEGAIMLYVCILHVLVIIVVYLLRLCHSSPISAKNGWLFELQDSLGLQEVISSMLDWRLLQLTTSITLSKWCGIRSRFLNFPQKKTLREEQILLTSVEKWIAWRIRRPCSKCNSRQKCGITCRTAVTVAPGVRSSACSAVV